MSEVMKSLLLEVCQCEYIYIYVFFVGVLDVCLH